VPCCARLFGTIDVALGHFRRYDKTPFCVKLNAAGFEVQEAFTMNKIGVFGWFLNGMVFKGKTLGKFKLKIFNAMTPFLRIIDRVLPWSGLSLVVVVGKSE
jgi:hypothetical protein